MYINCLRKSILNKQSLCTIQRSHLQHKIGHDKRLFLKHYIHDFLLSERMWKKQENMRMLTSVIVPVFASSDKISFTFCCLFYSSFCDATDMCNQKLINNTVKLWEPPIAILIIPNTPIKFYDDFSLIFQWKQFNFCLGVNGEIDILVYAYCCQC